MKIIPAASPGIATAANTLVARLIVLAMLAAVAMLPPVAIAGPASSRPAGLAIATHPDYLGYFVVTGAKNGEAAAKTALARCKKAVASDCTLTFSASSGQLVVGYSANGDLLFAKAETTEAAMQEFGRECHNIYAGNCLVDKLFDGAIKSYPPTPVERRKFAAIAFENPADTSDPRVWIVTGQLRSEDAIDTAMTSCNAALGPDVCRYWPTSGQTYIALYRDNSGGNGGMVINLSADAATGGVDLLCKAKSITCDLVALHAAKDETAAQYDLSPVTETVSEQPSK